jgi:uncharacterized phage protein (TIGR02218 family)
MKAMSAGLRALLATGEYVSADCWTVTLNGGAVVRWTSADIAVPSGGNTFAKGPAIKRGAISEKRGVEVATLSVQITADASDLINGQPIIPFVRNHGLDGASVKLERAFHADWASMRFGALGSIIRFAGKVTSVNSIQGAIVDLTVSSWLVLLNVNMPRNQYQAACLHTLYDSGCTLNPASFATSGAVVGSTGATLTFGTNLTPAASHYALGRIVFTSGANNGLSRTVRDNDASGNFTVSPPLPNGVAPGDTFTAFPGCDLTMGANGCAKFSNLVNFKATPFVPSPQTPLGSQSSTTTTKSGK